MKKITLLLLSLFPFVGMAQIQRHTLTQEITPVKTLEWEEKEVAKGIILKSYLGHIDDFQSQQSINVLEIDLDKSDKKLAISHVYDLDKYMTVDSMSMRINAIAGINATYADAFREKGHNRTISTVKVNGEVLQTNVLPFDHIYSWKAEGCFYFSNDRSNIGILRGNRAVYQNLPVENVITGSPMLIEHGIPVGYDFVPTDLPEVPATMDSLNMLDYENPYRHQGVRHPRTAIGFAGKNKIVMVTIDGRAKQAEGMSCAEVTKLMYEYLGCEEALNLDGGGSTTMWIKDFPGSGVVNYPSGSKNEDGTINHKGLRPLLNGIAILP